MASDEAGLPNEKARTSNDDSATQSISQESAAATNSLLCSCASGDEGAFGQLYQVTSPRIYGLIRHVLRCPDHAAEVTQEVYLDVWRHAARYDPTKGNALTWMTTIAHRRAIDRIRSITTAAQRDQNHARTVPTSTDNVWATVASQADAARVRTAMSRLPPKQQEALVLAYFRGYTQSQIAALLNVPLGTAKTRVRSGLTALRDALQPG